LLPTAHQENTLDALSASVAGTLPMGSSAGGEQPKFVAQLASGAHVLVKFTPPRGTPFGERWHDLLHAECLANEVLAQYGVAVARTQVVHSGLRTYLLSHRFDRHGAQGRRHVVAIGAVHEAFVPGPYQSWAATCSALERQGRLPPQAGVQAQALLNFGELIGNGDMHSGNLSLVVERGALAKGRFTLAPVYDMLPMRWRPDAVMGTAPAYTALALNSAAMTHGARAPASMFWGELAGLKTVSIAMRQMAAQMRLNLEDA
jgi:serine/threonine protein kinase HipA of HipAB toxin-antitoxin module